jgi:hypothetical protein
LKSVPQYHDDRADAYGSDAEVSRFEGAAFLLMFSMTAAAQLG